MPSKMFFPDLLSPWHSNTAPKYVKNILLGQVWDHFVLKGLEGLFQEIKLMKIIIDDWIILEFN